MGRVFPLAGLLRLRQLQQDSAASDLAAANGRVRDNSVVQARARRTLGASSSQPVDIDAMRAIAAARSSSSSMLSDLGAMATQHRRSAEEAQSEYHAARAKTVGLGKLEEKHSALTAAGDLRSEQLALDEIASVLRRRTQGERGQGGRA
jgi:flagellar FliJ protein